MEKPFKFALPSPNFNKNAKDACKPKPHFLTPSGMSLLPREKQPPPMYGQRGATVPPRYLQQQRGVSEKTTIAEAPPPPPPEKQYCEPCELELNSPEDLKRHRAQHEKCPVAGCLYRGHPSVMDKHVNALHASGLFDKFKKLSTPEEIAAWRDERRKRYPTLANVLLKQKAQEQRQKRGERLEANKNRFGKPNDRKRAQPNDTETPNPIDEKKPREEGKLNQKNNRKNRNKNKRNQKNKNNQQEIKTKVQTAAKPEEKMEEVDDRMCGGIKMFAGTSQLKDYKRVNDKKKIVTNNALFGLVGMYGSDDDDDEESEENERLSEQNEKTNDKIEEITNPATEENGHMECEDEKLVNSSSIKEINDSCGKIEDNSSKEDNNNVISDITPVVPNTEIIVSNENQIIENINENPIQNDNSSDEAPEETAIQRNAPDFPVKTTNNPQNTSTERTVEKPTNQTEKTPTIIKTKQAVKRKSGLDYRKARLRKQNTMLEKLLETDIRHERNVLLQCVRYVCENNFFGIGQNQEKPD